MASLRKKLNNSDTTYEGSMKNSLSPIQELVIKCNIWSDIKALYILINVNATFFVEEDCGVLYDKYTINIIHFYKMIT